MRSTPQGTSDSEQSSPPYNIPPHTSNGSSTRPCALIHDGSTDPQSKLFAHLPQYKLPPRKALKPSPCSLPELLQLLVCIVGLITGRTLSMLKWCSALGNAGQESLKLLTLMPCWVPMDALGSTKPCLRKVKAGGIQASSPGCRRRRKRSLAGDIPATSLASHHKVQKFHWTERTSRNQLVWKCRIPQTTEACCTRHACDTETGPCMFKSFLQQLREMLACRGQSKAYADQCASQAPATAHG